MIKKKCLLLNNNLFETLDAYQGVSHKALAQLNAFRKLFQQVEVVLPGYRITNKWARRAWYYILLPITVTRYILRQNDYVIYYRYNPYNIIVHSIFYIMPKKCHLYVEINTKPEFEYATLDKRLYLLNRFSERICYRAAYAVLTISPDVSEYVQHIYPQCRTKVIGNGYDPVQYPDQKDDFDPRDDLQDLFLKGAGRTKFVWVGVPWPWLGIDKIISIIDELENACLYLVGDEERFKQVVSPPSLLKSKNVFLLGKRNIKELQFIYGNCDFGLGSFNLQHKQINDAAELKVREYLYYGLPVIVDRIESQLQGVDFVHQYIDMPTLRKFLSMKFDRDEIKKYAKENLSWYTIFKKVFISGKDDVESKVVKNSNVLEKFMT
jgi:glycosyltransferase involved in cell wall biosynthesis